MKCLILTFVVDVDNTFVVDVDNNFPLWWNFEVNNVYVYVVVFSPNLLWQDRLLYNSH